MPVTHWLFGAAVLVLGALVGSFLNVVVYRMPLGLSVVHPGSRCGACGTAIAPWNNIPVLSWLFLRGKAACCKAPFSIRYPMVEAATAALAFALWSRLVVPMDGRSPPELEFALGAWALLFTFGAVLLVIALIDLDTLRIPDVLSLPLIPLGLATAWAFGSVTHVSVEQSLFGILIGGGTLLVVTYGYFAITGREGMGLGDYRLMAGVGAFLGWQSLLFLLIASAVQGLVFAGVVKLFRLEDALPRLDDPLPAGFSDGSDGAEPAAPEAAPEPDGPAPLAVPFGPFIALAALEWLLFEPLWMKLQTTWVFGMGS